MKARTWSEIGLFYAAAVWGSTFFMVKDAVADIHPIAMVGYRFGLGAFVLAPFLSKGDWKKDWKEGSVLGFVLMLLYVAQTEGLRYTSASNSGFITGLFVLFVPIFLFLIYSQKPTLGQSAAVALAVCGLWVLTGGIHGINKGDAYTLIAAATYAIHLILIDRYLRRGADPKRLAFHQFWFIGVVCMLWAGAIGAPFSIQTPKAAWILAFLVLFPTCSAFFIQLVAQQYVPPFRASLIFSMEPVFAALFAWTLGGEGFHPERAFGGLLIVSAMVVSELYKGEAPAPAPVEDKVAS